MDRQSRGFLITGPGISAPSPYLIKGAEGTAKMAGQGSIA